MEGSGTRSLKKKLHHRIKNARTASDRVHLGLSFAPICATIRHKLSSSANFLDYKTILYIKKNRNYFPLWQLS